MISIRKMDKCAQFVPLLKVNLKIISIFRVLPGKYRKCSLLIFILFLVVSAESLWLSIAAIRNYSAKFGFNIIPLAFEVCTVVLTINVLSVLIPLYLNGTTMKSVIFKLGDFRSAEKPKKLEALNKLLNRITVLLVIFWTTFYVISIDIYLKADHCFEDEATGCSMFVNMALPEEPSKREMMVFAHVTSIFMASFMGFFALLLCTSAWIFVSHRIVHLRIMLKRMITVEKSDRQECLKKCIKYHYKIIEISEMLASVYKTPSLVTMLLWQGIMAIVGIKFSSELDYPCLCLGLGYFVVILMLTSVGDDIVQRSTDLSTTILGAIPWDDDVQTRRDMILMMQRTNRALLVPIGSYSVWKKNLVAYVFRIPYTIMAIRIPN